MKEDLLSSRLAVSSLLLLLLSAPAAAQGNPDPPPPPKPRIAFEERAVVASGLTPGEKVVWFGVERRIDRELSTELVRRADVGDVAADGTARWEIPRPIANQSLWTAVDLESGEFVVAAPDGFRISRPARPPRPAVAAASGPDGILDGRYHVLGLMVRPGEGAWTFAGGDGGERDEDGERNGQARFAIDRFDPLPGSPPAPAKIQGKDLWFIVDALRLEISVHKGGVAQ